MDCIVRLKWSWNWNKVKSFNIKCWVISGDQNFKVKVIWYQCTGQWWLKKRSWSFQRPHYREVTVSHTRTVYVLALKLWYRRCFCDFLKLRKLNSFQTMSGSGPHSIPIPASSRQSPVEDSRSSSSLPSSMSPSSMSGDSKIVYERAFLINMRNSPLARTPPRNLPAIPRHQPPISCWKLRIRSKKNKRFQHFGSKRIFSAPRWFQHNIEPGPQVLVQLNPSRERSLSLNIIGGVYQISNLYLLPLISPPNLRSLFQRSVEEEILTI